MPNDLYDARDVLLDQLNEIMPVSVSYEKSGGNALEIAEGSMTVKYKTYPDGQEITLVQSNQYADISAIDSKGKKVDGDVDDEAKGNYNTFAGLSISAIGYPPTATPDPENPGHDVTETEIDDFIPTVHDTNDGDDHSGDVDINSVPDNAVET